MNVIKLVPDVEYLENRIILKKIYPRKNIFIIEGVNCVGKTTIAHKLYKIFRDSDYTVQMFKSNQLQHGIFRQYYEMVSTLSYALEKTETIVIFDRLHLSAYTCMTTRYPDLEWHEVVAKDLFYNIDTMCFLSKRVQKILVNRDLKDILQTHRLQGTKKVPTTVKSRMVGQSIYEPDKDIIEQEYDLFNYRGRNWYQMNTNDGINLAIERMFENLEWPFQKK